MEQNDRRELESGRFDQFEDEIELMDYLKVIWKWKYLILVGTLVCAIGAAVVSLNMTKVYGISTVLQPGILKVTEDGKISYIDSPKNIKALIETGAFEGKILKNIILPNKEDAPKSVGFKVTIPKGTNALDVLYETPDVDLGLQIIGGLNNALSERYETLINRYEENYNNDIRSKLNETFKVNEKIAKVKHGIGTAEAENESAISELSTEVSAKRAQISTAETENEAKLSELNTRISSKTAEINTAETDAEGKLSALNTRISSKTAEINTAQTENEAKLSQLTAGLSSKTTQISAVETENEGKALQISNNISTIGTGISAAEADKEEAITALVNREATIRAQIAAKKKQIHNLDQRISDVKREIVRISKNTDLLIEDRNSFLSGAKREDTILASVMYTNTIQQNIGYLNTLRSTVNTANYQIFQEQVGIEKLENDIKDLNARKENLGKQLRYKIENLKFDIKDLLTQKESLTKQTTYRLQNLTEEIKDLESQKQTSVKQTKSKIDNLQAEIKDLEAQQQTSEKHAKSKIGNLQADIRDLEAQKQASIKQTKSRIKNLQADIRDLEARKASLIKQTSYRTETLKSEIKDFENEKNYISGEIKTIEFKKNNIQNIQIIKSPKSSPSPIKPKTRLNVMLAGVVGLFLTVFLAFFVEYISKYKNRERD